MNFKNLFTTDGNDRAVSPVIGVILMVAITVILAAVIGTFVLGLGDQVQETSPNAQWNWDFTYNDGSDDTLKITHQGGDSVQASNLDFTAVQATSTAADGGTFTDDPISAGVSAQLDAGDDFRDSDSGGDTVRLIWSTQDGGQSSTLTEFEVPDNQ